MTEPDSPPIDRVEGRPLKLDLGCGKHKHMGCVGIDISKNSDADMIVDLNQGIPMPDNSIDEVYASHVLDHLYDLDKILIEIHRVCRNGARVHVWVPNCTTPNAFESPRRHLFFSVRTFDYYTGHVEFPTLFKVVKRPSILAATFPTMFLFRILHFELEVIKKEQSR